MPNLHSLCVVALTTVGVAPVVAQTPDSGSAARRVFADKCVGCHGPDLPHPKGRFGYVLDLRRIAGNPELVIPGRPDESELWALANKGDMPPPDSPHGPLSSAEKEAIRAWIAAGAPDTTSRPATVKTLTAVTVSLAELEVCWFGRFHLLALHFPIALVIAAGLAEGWSMWRRRPPGAARFCLWLGAMAAVPTAALGWLHAAAGNGAGSP